MGNVQLQLSMENLKKNKGYREHPIEHGDGNLNQQ